MTYGKLKEHKCCIQKGVLRYYELLVKLLSLPDAGITPERKFNETFLRGQHRFSRDEKNQY
jgi:hypothetical protein